MYFIWPVYIAGNPYYKTPETSSGTTISVSTCKTYVTLELYNSFHSHKFRHFPHSVQRFLRLITSDMYYLQRPFVKGKLLFCMTFPMLYNMGIRRFMTFI